MLATNMIFSYFLYHGFHIMHYFRNNTIFFPWKTILVQLMELEYLYFNESNALLVYINKTMYFYF